MPRASLLAFSCALVFLLTGCAAAPNVSSALPAPVDAPENASSAVLTATFFSCGDADSGFSSRASSASTVISKTVF